MNPALTLEEVGRAERAWAFTAAGLERLGVAPAAIEEERRRFLASAAEAQREASPSAGRPRRARSTRRPARRPAPAPVRSSGWTEDERALASAGALIGEGGYVLHLPSDVFEDLDASLPPSEWQLFPTPGRIGGLNR